MSNIAQLNQFATIVFLAYATCSHRIEHRNYLDKNHRHFSPYHHGYQFPISTDSNAFSSEKYIWVSSRWWVIDGLVYPPLPTHLLLSKPMPSYIGWQVYYWHALQINILLFIHFLSHCNYCEMTILINQLSLFYPQYYFVIPFIFIYQK